MKTKKLLTIVIILLLVISGFAFWGTRSEAATARDEYGILWNYDVVDGKARLISVNTVYVGTSVNPLYVPGTIAGYPVVQLGTGNSVVGGYTVNSIVWPENCQITTIGDYAFQSKGIEEIVIPDSVTSIGNQAFYSGTNKSKIQLGNNVQSIGNYAFAYVGSSPTSSVVENVVIPDSVTSIGQGAFTNVAIKNLTIGDGIETIDNRTFQNCNIETLTLGSNIKTIGADAFNNNKIAQVTLPNTVQTIGDKAFSTNLLESVTLPNSVTSIGTSSFENNKISELSIGTGITAIPEKAFAYNELQTLNIPGNVKTIGKDAFRYNKLTAVSLNEGLQTIGETAFRGEYNDPSYNQIAGTINIPSTVTSIAQGAFCNNNIETLNFGTANPTIGNWAFQTNKIKNLDLGTGLQTTGGSSVFSDNEITNINFGNVKTISEYALDNAFGEIDLIIPGTVETINGYAFRNNKNVKSLTLNEGIKTIRYNAFYGMENAKGDLTIPNSVTTLGSSAFSGMKSLDGVLTLGTGVNIIDTYVFYNMNNISRINVPSNVTRIYYSAFEVDQNDGQLGDIFIDNIEGSVPVDDRFQRYIHWRNETHNIDINVLPGVHILNATTGEELTAGDYACDSDIDVKVKLDEGYTYSDLVLIVEDGDNYEKLTTYNFDETDTYDLAPLLRNRRISVQSISQVMDLALRTFISRQNGIPVSESREPVVELSDGAFSFNHTKVPVVVAKDDVIEYTIRVYNQGLQDAKVDTLNVFIPEGLELVSGDLTNIINGWHVDQNDNRKVLTTNMSTSHIKGYTGNTKINYKDITLKLKVTKDRVQEVQTRLNMIAEIGQSSNIDGTITEDSDSTAGSITAPVSEDYKQREAGSSDENSYIKGQEDDDDFECVVLPGKAKVTYNLNLRKADIADEQLLEGATFRLYNERKEKITDADTDENGEINFGTMTSYGEGQDIYYMEEIVPPAGYAEKELCKIKVIVNKTIIDDQTGECAIDVVCEKVDYRVDTSRYIFVPVTNKTELAKIGSGETLTINGKEYVYSADANYKLMNDIDLSGSEWTPIENEIVGIFDGNGKKITGLTITGDNYNKSEVGLFRVFSGIFENTTFENVNINISTFANDAANLSGKTGVGTIAGVMKEGVIYNVTVSGTVTANVDNVGGFVGHTMPEKIVRAIDCTNSAAVTGKKNVGGVIGCSLGAVSMVRTNNTGAVKQIEIEGRIYFDNGNAGGLVGYVEATDYQETLFTGAYKDDNDEFILVARNEELEDGTYKMLLENRDKTIRNLIPNGVYTVYDSSKSVITGLENITLTDGTADLGTYTFKTVGKTTYYLKENSPATGYRPLAKYIKVVVTRAWDGEEYKFYVTVADTLLSDAEFNSDVPEDSSVEVNPKTGKTNEITEHEDVYWNVNKAEFIDCSNTASIGGTQTYHAGGLLGTACKCHAEFENCSNSGTITGTKVAGLAANITCYKYSDSTTKIDLENWSKVINCTNTGAINEVVAQSAAGGLVGEVNSNIKVYNSTNSGVITAKEAYAGGIIGKVGGKTHVIGCNNYGDIDNSITGGYYTNYVSGGIIGAETVGSEAKYDFSDREILIEDCTNTANVKSEFHVGGIIAILNSDNCIIKDCTVENADGEEIQLESNQGNIGGIVSVIFGNKTSIKNCNVKNVNMNWIGEGISSGNTYGQIGGIAGSLLVLNGDYFNKPSELIIDNCTVTDSVIDNVNGNSSSTCRAGIIAQVLKTDGAAADLNIDAYITNCTVRKTDVIQRAKGSIHDTAGIVGIAQKLGEGNLEIENCLVDECNIKTLNLGGGYEFDTAGIIAVNIRNANTKIINCNVKNTNIVNESNTMYQGGNDNAAGIIAISQNVSATQITDCNVYDNTSITQYQGNVGGILGIILNAGLSDEISMNNIERCTFKDSSIDCRMSVGDNSNTGGIVGSSGQSAYTYINDCEVDNVDVYTESVNAGGIIGHVMSKCDIDNCKVNETDITKNLTNGNESTLGGIAGYILGDRITNCTVSNSNIKNTYKCTMAGGIAGCSDVKLVDNCKVIGSEINNDETDFTYEYYNAFTAAGLIGFAEGDSITNSRVENTTVKGGNLVSGFIGITRQGIEISDNTIKNVTLEGNNIRSERANGRRIMAGAIVYGSNVTVDNVNVDGLTATGNIETFAGFVGDLDAGSTIQNSSVKGLDVDIKDVKSTAWGAVSGFAGTIAGNTTLKNVSVKDSELTTDEHIAAGLVGSIRTYGGSVPANIDGATIENVEITHNNTKTRDYDGLVSGLIGINPTGTNVTVNNAKVKDCTLVGNQAAGSTGILHMGGLMAFVDGDNSFTNCDVTGTTITNNTTGMTGGAAGMTQYDEDNSSIIERMLVLDNVTVDGKNTAVITGKNHVGGILGFGKINVTTPVTIKDIVLKTLGLTGDEEVNAVIGVATDHTGESDVTVSNVTIE